MNKEVKDLIQPYNPNIKNGTWYITSGTRDIKKPYLLARLEELEAENKQLQQKVNQLETNIDEAIKELFILKDMIYKPETREENFEIQRKISSILIELERGKE